MGDRPDERTLARDMVGVHGTEAAIVARENARVAALAGQVPQARSWIRVLGIIQRHQIETASPPRPGSPRSTGTVPGTDTSF